VVFKTFYLESAPGDMIANTPYVYGLKYPGPVQSILPAPPRDKVLSVNSESLLSFPDMDQLRLFATHLVIGRLKVVSKSYLLKDIDITAANRGFSYRKNEFVSSIVEKKYNFSSMRGNTPVFLRFNFCTGHVSS